MHIPSSKNAGIPVSFQLRVTAIRRVLHCLGTFWQYVGNTTAFEIPYLKSQRRNRQSIRTI